MDLLTRQTHGVVIGTMGSPGGTLGNVPAGQTRLIERLCVHLNCPDEVQEKPVVPRHRYSLKSASVSGSRPRGNLATLLRPSAPRTNPDLSKLYGANEAKMPQSVVFG